ncbi:MAG: glucose 1-dehydrogenase [SAR202 cluster bacterium]|nr:glucose 1-dehydrogenase [SAR202 cluster bacterium]
MRLGGKVALITGAAGGLGSAQARLLAAEGAKVAVADLAEDAGHALAADIAKAGGEAVFVKLDVTSEASWNAAVEAVVARYGALHVLVNNAGVHLLHNIDDTTPDEWDRVMAVNAKSVFLGTRAAVKAMRKSGGPSTGLRTGGSIVNISSTAGIVGSRISAAYNPSKAAVRIFTKSTALQYAKDNIRANSVHPGPADTKMLDAVYPDPSNKQKRAAELPLGRFATPRDIAYAVLFLASDESSYMTGAELVVDGGLTAQ